MRSLRLLLLFSLGLASCNTVQTTGNNAFHYSRRFVTHEIPRASRFVWNGVTGLFGSNDGSFWYADEMTGRPSVVINLSEQMVYLFKRGELAGGSPISSGAEGYDTRPGHYRVMEKDIDHKSSIYGDYEDYQGNVIMQNIDNRKDPRPPGTRFEGAKMYYFMRIYGGVGMHQGYLPGYAASHGCIRLPGHMAEKFFREVHVGTPVEVVP
ncbi:L,D-transpeptidase [Prosthecobacter fluviatilis]|uniref:L,D-transpeptidase n=1 Tax=Prosthecobacter fluviatilis TaxID=445931 RepID=A0ABW0KWL1_9BACT